MKEESLEVTMKSHNEGDEKNEDLRAKKKKYRIILLNILQLK